MTAVEGSLCPVCDHKRHNPCGFAGAKTERHGSLSVPIKTALCRIEKRIYRILRYIRFLLLQPVCRLLPLVQRVGFLDTLSGAAGAAPVLLPGDDPGAAEHRRHRRFVQRPVDGGHLGGGQVDVGGAGVLLHPLHLAGAGDWHDPGALAEHPGQRDLRRGAVFLGGQPVQQRQQPVAFILPRREWSGKFRLVHKYIPKGGFPAQSFKPFPTEKVRCRGKPLQQTFLMGIVLPVSPCRRRR